MAWNDMFGGRHVFLAFYNEVGVCKGIRKVGWAARLSPKIVYIFLYIGRHLSSNQITLHLLTKRKCVVLSAQRQKEKAKNLMHPFLGQSRGWKVLHLVLGEGVGKCAQWLGEACMVNMWCPVCAKSWRGCLGDSGECPPIMQVCKKVNEGRQSSFALIVKLAKYETCCFQVYL